VTFAKLAPPESEQVKTLAVVIPLSQAELTMELAPLACGRKPVVNEVEVVLPLPEMVLQPKPVPLVQIRALDAPLQEGTASPEGVVAVSAPRRVLADKEGRAV
jgi:hypothetical protein